MNNKAVDNYKLIYLTIWYNKNLYRNDALNIVILHYAMISLQFLIKIS